MLIDREFRVQRALENSGVPVANMHVLCEDASIIGAPFYIMEIVHGRTFDAPRLPDLSLEQRCEPIDKMNRVLVAIHDVSLGTNGLSDYGPGGDYFQRQLGR